MMRKNLSKLKPCPLCGSTHVEYNFELYETRGIKTVAFKIWCEDCGIELPTMGTSCVDRAVKRWNERAGGESHG